MSLPKLDLQRTFFEPEILFPGLGKAPGAERFSFFAERILPELRKRRPELEKMYCADNGRPAGEPVLMLAALILRGKGVRSLLLIPLKNPLFYS